MAGLKGIRVPKHLDTGLSVLHGQQCEDRPHSARKAPGPPGSSLAILMASSGWSSYAKADSILPGQAERARRGGRERSHGQTHPSVVAPMP